MGVKEKGGTTSRLGCHEVGTKFPIHCAQGVRKGRDYRMGTSWEFHYAADATEGILMRGCAGRLSDYAVKDSRLTPRMRPSGSASKHSVLPCSLLCPIAQGTIERNTHRCC